MIEKEGTLTLQFKTNGPEDQKLIPGIDRKLPQSDTGWI